MKNNNKVIAEFMGLNIDKGVQADYMEHELKYHTSWDWLMPVIEKIQNIFVDNPELDWQLYDDIRFSIPYLEDTYNMVLYTINQYNNK